MAYAAMTKDEAQRSIRTFYDAVKNYPVTIPRGWQGSDRDYNRIASPCFSMRNIPVA